MRKYWGKLPVVLGNYGKYSIGECYVNCTTPVIQETNKTFVYGSDERAKTLLMGENQEVSDQYEIGSIGSNPRYAAT